MKETEIKKIIEALLIASPITLTQTKVKNVFNRELQSVFTLKIVNGDSRRYDKV